MNASTSRFSKLPFSEFNPVLILILVLVPFMTEKDGVCSADCPQTAPQIYLLKTKENMFVIILV